MDLPLVKGNTLSVNLFSNYAGLHLKPHLGDDDFGQDSYLIQDRVRILIAGNPTKEMLIFHSMLRANGNSQRNSNVSRLY